MTQAFVYLLLHTLKNRLIAQAKRLRQPRYLISALIGVAYFYGVAGRHWVRGFHMASGPSEFRIPPELMEMVGTLFVLGSILIAWCGPTPVSPLAYTEAEIQYLFPAPIGRRGLVRWKILRGQVGVLISVSIFTLIAAPRIAPGGRAIFFAGAWLAFATMQLHLIGIRMTLHGLKKRGLPWSLRAGTALAVFVVVVAGAAYWAVKIAGPPPAVPGFGRQPIELLGGYVGRILDTWPAWIPAAPARLLVRPILAPDFLSFLLRLPAALAILAANYVWVMRSGVALEEGAAEAARHLAESRAAAMGQGRHRRARRIRVTRAPFVLTPLGRPEIAMFWKNLIAAFRTVGGVRALALAIGGTLGMGVLFVNLTHSSGLGTVLGSWCAMLAAMLLVMGPAMIRCDLRIDLQHIDLLKSYPISGRSLLLGSLMTPFIILTAVEWMLLAACVAFIPGSRLAQITLIGSPAILALTAAILAPAMIATATLVQNAGFLLVPGWVSLGMARTTGVERMGQGLLTSIGHLLALAVGFLPAALVFLVTWFVGSAFLGSAVVLPFSALLAAFVLAAECVLLALMLGRWVDRLDPSREFDTLTRQE